MFVCPKCGYRDDPCWKAHRYFLFVVYCQIEELEVFQPNLATRLREQRRLDEGPYHYHLGRTGYVLRAPIDLKQFLYDRGLIERYKRVRDRKQMQLEV